MTDQSFVLNAINQCFNNSNANSLDKIVVPTHSADILGWNINLISLKIAPSSKAIRKLLYYFTFADDKKGYNIHEYESLASRASHYSFAILGMRPFVTAFYRMVSSFSQSSTNPLATRKMSSTVRFCFNMWQIVAFICYEHPGLLSVPLLLFDKNRIPDFVIYSDASPFGIAAAIFSPSGQLLFYSNFNLVFLSPHGYDSDFQNAREYLGYFFGIFLLKYCYTEIFHPNLKWINDNTTALSWAENDKCKSMAAQSAHIATTWLSVILGIPNPETHHIPGIEMGDIDSLSRFKNHSLPIELYVDLSKNEILIELFKLFDFTIQHSLDSHFNVMLRILDILKPMIR